LVRETIQRMKDKQADEVMLETEITNTAALRLYESKSK
jgi:ribosomal protein S18 acetylase RimI-like enzyme